MITLIAQLFWLFAVIVQILGLVLIAVGIFVPEARGYFIIRGIVLTILGGFGFYFHDKLDDWLEEKRNKKRKRKEEILKRETEESLKQEQEEKLLYDALTDAQKNHLNKKKKFKKILRFSFYLFLISGLIIPVLEQESLVIIWGITLILLVIMAIVIDVYKKISRNF